MKRLLSLLAVLTLTALAAGCSGRPKASSDPESARPHTGPSLVVLDLTKGVPEKQAPSFLSVVHQGTFDELVRTVSAIADDKSAQGVFVRFGGASFGIARAMEIGEALDSLRKKNKEVVCHAEGFTNTTFYAAARGCSKIILSAAGTVETIGIAAQLLYAHKLLAEELHLSIDFLQVGKFKGAEEPLTRDGPSDEARTSLQSVLTDMRGSWLEGIAAGRPRSGMADAVEDGPYSAKRAKDLGLIDEIGYSDDAREATRKAVGAVRDDVRFGPGRDDKSDDLGELVRVLSGDTSVGAPIALVRATGSISMSGSGGGGLLGGGGGITSKAMDRLLLRLEKDDDVRAVVLRIDSPGGSALASDLIWHRLMKLREKKPLVVSVGDMAASGGYYLACAGNVIFAEPASIVGSIGVVGGKIGFDHALELIGVHAETFAANPANPNAASRAAYESPLLGWDDATRARVLESMTGVYDLFLARIAEGRKTSVDNISPSAEGRIFSGTEGKRRGLVDEIGGLGAAIEKARELAKLPASARVEGVESTRGLLETITGGDGDSESSEQATTATMTGAARPVDLVREAAPDLLPFLTSLAPLADGERMLAAVPYAIVVR